MEKAVFFSFTDAEKELHLISFYVPEIILLPIILSFATTKHTKYVNIKE